VAKLSFYRWLPHLIVPALVLLVGAVATLLTALQLRDANDARDASRLRLEANQAVAALEERLEGHSALLRGLAGLFAASDDVTAAEFAAYVERLGLGTRYPGVLGIGYSTWLPDAEARTRLEAALRGEGRPSFRVWPAGGRPPYTAIVYLSPERPNAPALGYDMFSEATRREAMQRAVAVGDLAMSGPVTLVQGAGARRQRGVLMFLPVTEPDGRGGSELRGFVYSPLRAGDLLQTVFPARPDRLVDVSVYDGAARPENLLFGTAASAAGPEVLRAVPVAGRTWTLAIRTRPAFDAASNRSLVY